MDRSPAVPDRTVHSCERLLEIWSIVKKAVRLSRPFNQTFTTSTSNFIAYSKSGFIKACFWLSSDESREKEDNQWATDERRLVARYPKPRLYTRWLHL